MKRYYVQHGNLHAVNQPCNCAKPCTLVVEFTDVRQLVRQIARECLSYVEAAHHAVRATPTSGSDAGRLAERLRAIIGDSSPHETEGGPSDPRTTQNRRGDV